MIENKTDKNISNVRVSNNIYKQLKIASIDKEVSLQEVVQEILEKAFSKKS